MTELIRVTDERGQLLSYVRQLLDALAFFPDDELSLEIARFAIEREYREYLKQGPGHSKVCRATEILINAAEKRATQVHVAGLVALAFMGLHATGKRPSQEAAVRCVSELNSKANKFPFERWSLKDRKRVEYEKAVSSDPASVRQIFSDYRCVAHICAARVVSTDYLEPLPLFEPASDADATRLATVLSFQALFQTKTFKQKKWGLRLIEYPAVLGSKPSILEPTHELMEALVSGET